MPLIDPKGILWNTAIAIVDNIFHGKCSIQCTLKSSSHKLQLFWGFFYSSVDYSLVFVFHMKWILFGAVVNEKHGDIFVAIAPVRVYTKAEWLWQRRSVGRMGQIDV